MEWFRLYAEFSTDPKVQSMSEAMQRRLVMLFCLRCSNTLETLQEQDICFALRIDETELAETKALFVSKGFFDEDWNPVNWDKRQKASDSSTTRVREHRAKKKQLLEQECNVTETVQIREEEKRVDKKETKADRASRLPANWSPGQDEIDFCKAERPDLNPRSVGEQFRDYWIAQPGAKGRKTDWTATWRNWVRNQRASKSMNGHDNSPFA